MFGVFLERESWREFGVFIWIFGGEEEVDDGGVMNKIMAERKRWVEVEEETDSRHTLRGRCVESLEYEHYLVSSQTVTGNFGGSFFSRSRDYILSVKIKYCKKKKKSQSFYIFLFLTWILKI